MKTALLPVLFAAAIALGSIPANAQMVVSAKSGVLNFTEGQVQMDGHLVQATLTKYPEMKENSVVRTEAGRAEVLLTPGTILRLGENSSLRMITNRLIDTRVELQSGSAVLEALQMPKDNNVTVVVKNGAVGIAKAGVYRFDVQPAEVKVFRGEAAAEINGQTTPLGAGRMTTLDGAKASVEKFNAEDTDALDHWSKRRGELLAMANPSTAKSVLGGYGGYGSFGGYGLGSAFAGGLGCSPSWGFNQWYGMYTYVPCNGYFMDPYGFGFWSPYSVNQLFYNPGYFFGRGYGYGGRYGYGTGSGGGVVGVNRGTPRFRSIGTGTTTSGFSRPSYTSPGVWNGGNGGGGPAMSSGSSGFSMGSRSGGMGGMSSGGAAHAGGGGGRK